MEPRVKYIDLTGRKLKRFDELPKKNSWSFRQKAALTTGLVSLLTVPVYAPHVRSVAEHISNRFATYERIQQEQVPIGLMADRLESHSDFYKFYFQSDTYQSLTDAEMDIFIRTEYATIADMFK